LADPANAPPEIPETPSSQFFNRLSNDQEKLDEVIVKFTLFGGIHLGLETVCEIGCPEEKSILTKAESDLQPRTRSSSTLRMIDKSQCQPREVVIDAQLQYGTEAGGYGRVFTKNLCRNQALESPIPPTHKQSPPPPASFFSLLRFFPSSPHRSHRLRINLKLHTVHSLLARQLLGIDQVTTILKGFNGAPEDLVVAGAVAAEQVEGAK
jgi:hypothetical protein